MFLFWLCQVTNHKDTQVSLFLNFMNSLQILCGINAEEKYQFKVGGSVNGQIVFISGDLHYFTLF